ncbi:kinase-like protein, partial [Marasmius fiardii PR-910]
IHEIMAGLEYLHSLSPPIVHADIKGANILVSEDHHCLLADFGLAAVSAETLSMIPTTSGVIKGSIRWMAPELYAFSDGMSDEKTKDDKTPRDIYAFACTVLEIMTGKPPFFNLIDAAVIYQVSVRRLRPKKPSEGWCPDHIWNLVEICWDEDPLKRPRARAIHSYLQHLIFSGHPAPEDPAFIGYFNQQNFATHGPAGTDPNPFVSDNSSESHSSAPSSPDALSPLHPELPQASNSAGISQAENIPAPTSHSAVRYVAEFFRLNDRILEEAVENTRFSVQKLFALSPNDQGRYVQTTRENLCNYSDVFVAALEVIARLHPVIGGKCCLY